MVMNGFSSCFGCPNNVRFTNSQVVKFGVQNCREQMLFFFQLLSINSVTGALTFSTFVWNPCSWARKPHAQRVWQEPLLHDRVTERVAQRPLQLIAQLQWADVALLPDMEADVQLRL